MHNAKLQNDLKCVLLVKIIKVSKFLYLGHLEVTVDDHVVTSFDCADVLRLTSLDITLPATEGDVIRQMH